MKILCTNCGCHFPEEFKETLEPKCNFWGSVGAANLPVVWKEKIWNWSFDFNFDQLAGETGVQLFHSWGLAPYIKQDTFEHKIKGWSKMTDTERRKYEKEHFMEITRKNNEDTRQKQQLISAVQSKIMKGELPSD